jgi:hypothetical protein
MLWCCLLGVVLAGMTAYLPRVLLVVAGLEQSHWRQLDHVVKQKARVVDVRAFMPRDPTALRGPTLDSVARQTGFVQAVQTTVDTARVHSVEVIGCKAGKHRSTVTAAASRLVLLNLGIQFDNNHLPILIANHSAAHMIFSLQYCMWDASTVCKDC